MLILYHDNCFDGFCAAWLLWRTYPESNYIPVNYGEDPPWGVIKDRSVIIADFSYPKETLLKMKEVCKSLTVLDHHKTSAEELSGLDFCTFDMNKSGSRLVQEHFQLPDHWLIDYTEDRDLWHWKLPNSKEINAAIRQTPFNFMEFETLSNCDLNWVKEQGEIILKVEENIVNKLILKAEETELAGYKVLQVNSPIFQSEIGEKLCIKHPPFSVVYYYDKNVIRYSLRSIPEFDVSEIAKKFEGGGGHKNAAGFEIKKVIHGPK